MINQGATAEFGRSAGGFVNVITKSGTNELAGSAHYYGQWDGVSAGYPVAAQTAKPDFLRSQFGFTLGGPIVRDRAFFFVAYDQQAANETKQVSRLVQEPANLAKLQQFLTTQWPGLFDDEFGPIERTDDAQALVAKADFHVDGRNQLTFKYNYSWSEQLNGTFDVDTWGLSANGVETDEAHAFNLSWRSLMSSTLSHELRFQWAREDRVRGYDGPLMPGSQPPATQHFAALGGRPFPDIAMDFADGFRIGLPFFLPIEPAYDTRLQVVDNWSWLKGRHLFKAGTEYNRTHVLQHFVGFANGRYIFDSVDGFINFATQGNLYVTCSDGSDSATGTCPAGTVVTGPVLFYLQSGTVPGVPPGQLGLSGKRTVDELAFYVQDTWRPNDRLTVNLGLRWEGAWHPETIVEPQGTFYAGYLSDPRFPSDGTIPNDFDNFQPRLGLAWDPAGDGRTVLRANAGAYFSRVPILVFAQSVTTNGAFQQNFFRNSFLGPGLAPPPLGELIDGSNTPPFLPDIHVTSRDLELPRTWSFAAEIERELGAEMATSVAYQHARTDNLFRFVNRNDAAFGGAVRAGHAPDGRRNRLPNVDGKRRTLSRYHAVTVGLRGRDALGDRVTFDLSYTLSYDRSDDDNERDPFTFRYASAANLASEYGWSDRDRRHKATGYLAFDLPGDLSLSNIVRYLSASPVSESCAQRGERAAVPTDRICADGTILQRNTLRRGNAFFTWDLKLTRAFEMGSGTTVEPVFEIFNLTNADNSLDTAQGSLLFNFDGTIRSGLGDTRRAQLGARVRF